MAPPDEEDDYMTMVFEDEPIKIETSLQRRARIKRENEEKARVMSKAERKAEEEAAREEALSTAIDSSNKGFKMMAKLGFKSGDTLGKSGDGRKEPIGLTMKGDKGGIGLDSEKKRKFREHKENEAKRVKVEQGDYRDRVRQELEEKKLGSELYNAQKTAQRLDEKAEEGTELEDLDPPFEGPAKFSSAAKPLKSINVVWRGLVRSRLEKDRDYKKGRLHLDSLPRTRLPTYMDEDEDEDYKLAMGRDTTSHVAIDDLDEEDPELEEFEKQPLANRLDKVVSYLHDTHHYCFWCKYQYPDAAMDGCPGTTEDDH